MLPFDYVIVNTDISHGACNTHDRKHNPMGIIEALAPIPIAFSYMYDPSWEILFFEKLGMSGYYKPISWEI